MSVILGFMLIIVGIVAFIVASKSAIQQKKYILLFLSLVMIIGGAYGVVKAIQSTFYSYQLKKLEQQVQAAEDKAKKLEMQIQKYEDERKVLLSEIDTLNKEFDASVRKHKQIEKDLQSKLQTIQSSYIPVTIAPKDARKFLLDRIQKQEIYNE